VAGPINFSGQKAIKDAWKLTEAATATPKIAAAVAETSITIE